MTNNQLKIVLLDIQVGVLKQLLKREDVIYYNDIIQRFILEFSEEDAESWRVDLSPFSQDDRDTLVLLLEKAMIPYD